MYGIIRGVPDSNRGSTTMLSTRSDIPGLMLSRRVSYLFQRSLSLLLRSAISRARERDGALAPSSAKAG